MSNYLDQADRHATHRLPVHIWDPLGRIRWPKWLHQQDPGKNACGGLLDCEEDRTFCLNYVFRVMAKKKPIIKFKFTEGGPPHSLQIRRLTTNYPCSPRVRQEGVDSKAAVCPENEATQALNIHILGCSFSVTSVDRLVVYFKLAL